MCIVEIAKNKHREDSEHPPCTSTILLEGLLLPLVLLLCLCAYVCVFLRVVPYGVVGPVPLGPAPHGVSPVWGGVLCCRVLAALSFRPVIRRGALCLVWAVFGLNPVHLNQLCSGLLVK